MATITESDVEHAALAEDAHQQHSRRVESVSRSDSCKKVTMNEANRPIPLTEIRVEINIGRKSLQVPIKATLRLLPQPGLIIETEERLLEHETEITNAFRNKKPVILSLGNAATIETYIVHLDDKVTLRPSKEPLTVRKTKESLHSVQFDVLNFPEFWGREDQTIEFNGEYRRLGSLRLKTPSWLIEIAAVSNLSEIVKTLKVDGGYAITHRGSIARLDDKPFPVKDAEQLIEGLRFFLSFARGAWCAPTLQIGYDCKGDKAWEKWGVQKVSPWHSSLSWFDRHMGHILSEIFPGFWQQFQDRKEFVCRVLSWYMSSNLGTSHYGVGIDGSLIFTQAALERIAYEKVGKKRIVGEREEKTGEWIARAFNKVGICAAIPSSCKKLTKLQAKFNWQHGPHALTDIRNDLVHPEQKFKDISIPYFEAWKLGQWYLDLLLLKLFGFNGEYGNRLTQEWVGQVERVPWAEHNEKTS